MGFIFLLKKDRLTKSFFCLLYKESFTLLLINTTPFKVLLSVGSYLSVIHFSLTNHYLLQDNILQFWLRLIDKHFWSHRYGSFQCIQYDIIFENQFALCNELARLRKALWTPKDFYHTCHLGILNSRLTIPLVSTTRRANLTSLSAMIQFQSWNICKYQLELTRVLKYNFDSIQFDRFVKICRSYFKM